VFRNSMRSCSILCSKNNKGKLLIKTVEERNSWSLPGRVVVVFVSAVLIDSN
jgi:hypothetical protein